MSLDIQIVRIVGTPIFKCAVCGTTGRGSTVTIELGSAKPAVIAAVSRNPPVSRIPVGWACYGRDVVKCPEHVT